jgi:hypothetical protein
MDPKLMSDFEELEGLIDQGKEDETVDNDDDDDANFRPQQASVLSSAEIYMEVGASHHIICLLFIIII